MQAFSSLIIEVDCVATVNCMITTLRVGRVSVATRQSVQVQLYRGSREFSWAVPGSKVASGSKVECQMFLFLQIGRQKQDSCFQPSHVHLFATRNRSHCAGVNRFGIVKTDNVYCVGKYAESYHLCF
jgi:hypothetical protein